MGLLDDAIREHLDLKRRRGADPAEVARLEQEALGPVRREPVPAEPVPPDDDAHAPHDAPAESADPARAASPVDAYGHPAETPHALPPEERHDPPHGDPLFAHHEPEPEPAPAHHEDHAPEEHRPEPHAAAHPDEDVLEETPEFLQETPEHDRLWFEQRPPRDFDFDG